MAKKSRTAHHQAFLLEQDPIKDPGHLRRVKWAKGLSFLFGGLGIILLLWFTNDFGWLHLNAKPGSMAPEIFAMFRAHFGDAVAGASALTSIGAVLYSFSLIAEQIAGERESRLQQDMPVIFIMPRLNWSVIGVRSGKLEVSDLALSLGIRNVADAPATQLELNSTLTYTDREGNATQIKLTGLELCQFDHISGRSEALGQVSDGFEQRVSWPLANSQHGALIEAMLAPNAGDLDRPSLVLKLEASCQTIREASFSCQGEATWSPKYCRNANEIRQRDLLQGFAAEWAKFDRENGGDLDKFFKKSRESPLVPVIHQEEKH